MGLGLAARELVLRLLRLAYAFVRLIALMFITPPPTTVRRWCTATPGTGLAIATRMIHWQMAPVFVLGRQRRESVIVTALGH